MKTPALSMARMCDGFSEKLCGDADPSTRSVGSATPCMTCDTKEWIGLMVTTTSIAFGADSGPGAQADPSSKPKMTPRMARLRVQGAPDICKVR